MPPKPSYMLTEAQKAKRMAEIKAIFKDFLKVIKVVSLYPEGNPLPQSMRRNFSERLAQHIEDYGGPFTVGRYEQNGPDDGEWVEYDIYECYFVAKKAFDSLHRKGWGVQLISNDGTIEMEQL